MHFKNCREFDKLPVLCAWSYYWSWRTFFSGLILCCPWCDIFLAHPDRTRISTEFPSVVSLEWAGHMREEPSRIGKVLLKVSQGNAPPSVLTQPKGISVSTKQSRNPFNTWNIMSNTPKPVNHYWSEVVDILNSFLVYPNRAFERNRLNSYKWWDR